MSHWPGFHLENFVTDAMRVVHPDDMAEDEIRRIYPASAERTLTIEQFARLVAVFEPHREYVERRLAEYEEDEHGSWRDYRGSSFDEIPQATWDAAEAEVRRSLAMRAEDSTG